MPASQVIERLRKLFPVLRQCEVFTCQRVIGVLLASKSLCRYGHTTPLTEPSGNPVLCIAFSAGNHLALLVQRVGLFTAFVAVGDVDHLHFFCGFFNAGRRNSDWLTSSRTFL